MAEGDRFVETMRGRPVVFCAVAHRGGRDTRIRNDRHA